MMFRPFGASGPQAAIIPPKIHRPTPQPPPRRGTTCQPRAKPGGKGRNPPPHERSQRDGVSLYSMCFAPWGRKFYFEWAPRPGATPRAMMFRPFGASGPQAAITPPKIHRPTPQPPPRRGTTSQPRAKPWVKGRNPPPHERSQRDGVSLYEMCFARWGRKFNFEWAPRPGATPRAMMFRPFGASAALRCFP